MLYHIIDFSSLLPFSGCSQAFPLFRIEVGLSQEFQAMDSPHKWNISVPLDTEQAGLYTLNLSF